MSEQQSSTAPAPVNPASTLAHQVAQLIQGRVVANVAMLSQVDFAQITPLSLAGTLRMVSEEFRQLSGYAEVISRAAPPAAPAAAPAADGTVVSVMPEPPQERTSAMTNEAILSLVKNGHKPPEIARALNLKPSKVRRLLRKSGLLAPAAATTAVATAPAHNGKGTKKGGKKATPFE